MNKNDIFMLTQFRDNMKVTSLESYKISELIKTMGENKLSQTKIRKFIKEMMDIDYMAEGLMDGNSKTYYITAKGIDFLDGIGATKGMKVLD